MAYTYDEKNLTKLGQLKQLAQRTKSELDILDLRVDTLERDIDAKINAKIGSVYKAGGSKAADEIVAGLLVEANKGIVYNLSTALTLTSSNKGLFVENAENSYPAGTNLVVVETVAPVYAAASGTAASGITYYERHGSEGAYEYSTKSVEEGASVAGLYTKTSDGTYKFDALSGFVDLTAYAVRDTDATTGHIAEFDANGNPVDSGHTLSEYLTAHQDISGKTDLSVIAPAYDGTAIYAVGDLVVYNGVLYKCTTAISSAEADFDSSHWTATDLESVVAAINTVNDSKADKPSTATADNLAAFDSSKNPVDSGIAKGDVVTKIASPTNNNLVMQDANGKIKDAGVTLATDQEVADMIHDVWGDPET